MTFEYVHPKPGKSYVQDKDRNITLIDRPPVPEQPHRMELVISDKKLIFDVEEKTPLRRSDKKRDVYWKILRAYGDENLLKNRNEIIQIVKDALMIRGSYGLPERTNSVTVDFNDTVWGERS